MLNREKLNVVFLRQGTRHGCSLPPLFAGSLDKSNGTTTILHKKERKGMQTGKEEAKLSLFADDISLYPKDTTVELLELTGTKWQDTRLTHKMTSLSIDPQQTN